MKRWNLDAEIMKLRGLGYNQAEIAEEMDMSQGAIQYRLKKINERAKEEGDDAVFFEMCSIIYLPKLLRLLK